VDTLVLVSSDGEGTRVRAHHLTVVAAARGRGVRHIVALSGVDADVDSPFCYAITNGLTEQAIRDSACGFSLVRASVFAEFFLHFVRPARSTGQLLLPAGDGRLGLVSRLDVGRCLAALTRSAPTGEVHDITGPAALDVTAVAAIATKAWARPVTYRPITEPEYLKQLATAEDPWWAYAYTSMFASIREQRWDRVSDEVQRLTGRSPRTLWQLMAETASD